MSQLEDPQISPFDQELLEDRVFIKESVKNTLTYIGHTKLFNNILNKRPIKEGNRGPRAPKSIDLLLETDATPNLFTKYLQRKASSNFLDEESSNELESYDTQYEKLRFIQKVRTSPSITKEIIETKWMVRKVRKANVRSF